MSSPAEAQDGYLQCFAEGLLSNGLLVLLRCQLAQDHELRCNTRVLHAKLPLQQRQSLL